MFPSSPPTARVNTTPPIRKPAGLSMAGKAAAAAAPPTAPMAIPAATFPLFRYAPIPPAIAPTTPPATIGAMRPFGSL